ncbi:MAG: hypothetical protein LUG83_04685, partial [Lachnospiraceae bacterium]|nr:hypothetical protein [Lachnospiraceae bacterium]
ITAVCVYILAYFKDCDTDRSLSCAVMSVFGVGIFGFRLRREYLSGELPYDNSRKILRFWISFAGVLVLSFACAFLPVECWPLPAAFVLLSLFGSVPVGVIASSVLVMIPVLVSDASVTVFFVYFISGVFAVCFFCPIEKDMKVGCPLFLSMLCLFVSESAEIILTANARPSLEMFIMPVINIVLSTILLIGIVSVYSRRVIYYYRDNYLEINDTENPVLANLRENSKEEYRKSIHTAYFCERIASRLGFDTDALKCAGYYHVKGKELEKIMTENDFPPDARNILSEYLAVKGISGKKTPIKSRETAVLFCSDTVVGAIMQLIEKSGDKALDYDKVVDMLFKRFEDSAAFNSCDISVKELCEMKRIFREEKLYYDFLR